MSEGGDDFGRRLRAARDAAGLTRDELAARAGVHSATIQNYERRSTPPRDLRLIPGLEHALGVSLGSATRKRRQVADPKVSRADVGALARALSARASADEQARADVLPLIERLAARTDGTDSERAGWARRLTAVLADPFSDASEGALGAAPPLGVVTEDDPDEPSGAGFDVAGVNVDASTDDAAKPDDDSAQA